MLLSGDFDMDKNIKTGAPLKKRLMKYLPLYLLALPSIAYLIINNYMPMSGLILAFKDFSFAKGMWESPWNGLENFSYLFGSKWAVIMFRNTILYNVAFLVLGNVFAILVAILLNEVVSKKAKQVYQTVILIPHLMSMVIIGYLVFAFLSGTNGFINKSILEPLGLEGVNWYTEKGYWPVILTIVYLWKSFGFQSIVYFATLVGFDRSYYEAAVVDGATTWQQIRNITLPLLRPTVIILVIMSLGRMFASDFGLFYQVPQDSGMLYETTTTIDTFVYRALMQDNDVGRSPFQTHAGHGGPVFRPGLLERLDQRPVLPGAPHRPLHHPERAEHHDVQRGISGQQLQCIVPAERQSQRAHFRCAHGHRGDCRGAGAGGLSLLPEVLCERHCGRWRKGIKVLENSERSNHPWSISGRPGTCRGATAPSWP